jgi:hypothetical protein
MAPPPQAQALGRGTAGARLTIAEQWLNRSKRAGSRRVHSSGLREGAIGTSLSGTSFDQE